MSLTTLPPHSILHPRYTEIDASQAQHSKWPVSDYLFPSALHELHPRRWGPDNSNADYIVLYSDHEKFVVQITAVIGSVTSLIAVSVAFYWFCRMRKRFRHKLIMLLILGDWTRALWYLIFSLVSFKRGTVDTHTRFCQAAGYLIQMSTEISDFAVLFISLHGALQIFKPSISIVGGDDGFYKRRHWIYAFVLLVPQLFASLVFVEPDSPGYLSQGAFCSLPIRPIWYRLVLAWVPRLTIWMTILGLAIGIYVHVHREFEAFSQAFRQHSATSSTFLTNSADMAKRRDSSPGLSPHRGIFPDIEQSPDDDCPPHGPLSHWGPTQMQQTPRFDSIDQAQPIAVLGDSTVASEMVTVAPEGRRSSRVRIEVPAVATDTSEHDVEANLARTRRKSVANSLFSWASSTNRMHTTSQKPDSPASMANRRTSNQSSLYHAPDPINPILSTIMTTASVFSLGSASQSRRSSAGSEPPPSRRLSSEKAGRRSLSSGRHQWLRSSTDGAAETLQRIPRRIKSKAAANAAMAEEEARMAQKRAHIRRQLRQVFVYPLVYILMWVTPFVALCFSYNSRYAKHPPFILATLNNFCLCIMGTVNSVVFSNRERPWRHMPSNPGRSFWGSFRFWWGCDGDGGESKRNSESTWGGTDFTGSEPEAAAAQQRQQQRRGRGTVDANASPTSAPGRPGRPATSTTAADPSNFLSTTGSIPSDTQQRQTPPPPQLLARMSFPPQPASSSSLTALARSGLKRASMMASTAGGVVGSSVEGLGGGGERRTDREKAARDLAYERLAWEKAEREREREIVREMVLRAEASAGGGGAAATAAGEDELGGGGADDGGGERRGSVASVGGLGLSREWWERGEGAWSIGRGASFGGASGESVDARDFGDGAEVRWRRGEGEGLSP